MKVSFEFEINGRTYVSKKMTPPLRARLLKVLPFLKFSDLAANQNDLKMTLDVMADTFELVPSLMWEFIQDADKKDIGTYQSFLESLDDNMGMILKFLEWGVKKVEELNNFLAQKPETVKV